MAPRKKKVTKSTAAQRKVTPLNSIPAAKKNLGAIKGLSVDPADIERLSELHPNDLPSTLEPHVRDAVFKRRQEKGLKVSKPTLSGEAAADVARLSKRAQRRSRKQPTVRRGPGGRIESIRTPIAPLGDAEVQPKPDARFAAPGAKPRKGRTRSGKKIDKITGKVVQPTVKRDESGKAVGLSEEERKAAVTTVLPIADRNVMDPKPAAQPIQPAGTLKRGGMRGQRGFAGSYVEAQKATHAAIYHLNNAHFALGAGLPHEEHLQNFDAIHANIKDKPLHMALGAARHLVSISGGKNSPELTTAHNVIKGRLEEGRIAHEENVQRAMAGREKNGS